MNPGYLGALQTFRHTLAQRNAALRDRRGADGVFAWDAVLTRSGAEGQLVQGEMGTRDLRYLWGAIPRGFG